MRMVRIGGLALAISAFLVTPGFAAAKNAEAPEAYIPVPLPAGFQVIQTELEGPVFADPAGKTLYRWPMTIEGVDKHGEMPGKPGCLDTVTKTNARLNDIYYAGLLLPDLDRRRSCAQEWPPVLASADAKPVGKWTVIARPNGQKQWAYQGAALYTSVLDKQPGDTSGARGAREIIAPAAAIPPQFAIASMTVGRMLTTVDGESIYTWDKDGPNKSNCDNECRKEWKPVLAAGLTRPIGDWSIFERSPGIKQWAFKKKPVYTHMSDSKAHSLEGGDVRGWHNVFMMPAPALPKEFTQQETRSGYVLADKSGKTIYVYYCMEPTLDQFVCDNPDSPQMYRFAMCGGGDPDKCVQNFPYVLASAKAESGNRTWTAIDINPKTGRLAAPGEAGSLHVWAFRGRPVYTFAGDKKPGDIEADSWGQGTGRRNGFRAYWIRDDFRNNDE